MFNRVIQMIQIIKFSDLVFLQMNSMSDAASNSELTLECVIS
jgi:hypothetical protein